MRGITDIYKSYKNWLFPPKEELPAHLVFLLQKIFPSVNWKTVAFYKRMPWFMTFGRQYFTGITLPDTYSFSHYQIHHRGLNLNDCTGIATIVHEAYHILQFKEYFKGRGIGFFRPGLIIYLSCWLKEGYFNHTMETPAYRLERDFINGYMKYNSYEAGCLTSILNENKATLLHHNAPTIYKCGILNLFKGTLLVLLITVLKPIVEFILLMGLISVAIPAKVVKTIN